MNKTTNASVNMQDLLTAIANLTAVVSEQNARLQALESKPAPAVWYDGAKKRPSKAAQKAAEKAAAADAAKVQKGALAHKGTAPAIFEADGTPAKDKGYGYYVLDPKMHYETDSKGATPVFKAVTEWAASQQFHCAVMVRKAGTKAVVDGVHFLSRGYYAHNIADATQMWDVRQASLVDVK